MVAYVEADTVLEEIELNAPTIVVPNFVSPPPEKVEAPGGKNDEKPPPPVANGRTGVPVGNA